MKKTISPRRAGPSIAMILWALGAMAATGSAQSPVDWNAGDPVLQLQQLLAEQPPAAASPVGAAVKDEAPASESDYCGRRYSAETRSFTGTGMENEVIGGGTNEIESQIDYLANVSNCKDERGMPLADRPVESVELWASGYGGPAKAMICADLRVDPRQTRSAEWNCAPARDFSYSPMGNWWVVGRALFPSVRRYEMGAEAVFARNLRIVPQTGALRVKKTIITFMEYPPVKDSALERAEAAAQKCVESSLELKRAVDAASRGR